MNIGYPMYVGGILSFLNPMKYVGEAVVDILREILWGIIRSVLWVIDIEWRLILKTITLDFFSLGNISDWFSLVMVTMFLFILFRVIIVSVKFYFSDTFKERVNVVDMMVRMFAISLAIAVAPLAFQTVNSLGIDVINGLGNIVAGEEKHDKSISSIIINSSGTVGYEDETLKSEVSEKEYNEYIAAMQEIHQEHFNINETSDVDDEEYKYFPSWMSLFIVLAECIIFAKKFLMFGISIVLRMFNIMFEYLMAPYAVSTLLEPGNGTFGKWVSRICGDIFTNVIQVLALYFVLTFINSGTLHKTLGYTPDSFIISVLLLIAGMMAIDRIPEWMGHLIGGSGTTGITEIGQQTGNAVGSAAGTVMGGATIAAGTVAGAAAGYAAGQSSLGKIGGMAIGGIKGGAKGGLDAFRDSINRSRQNGSGTSSSSSDSSPNIGMNKSSDSSSSPGRQTDSPSSMSRPSWSSNGTGLDLDGGYMPEYRNSSFSGNSSIDDYNARLRERRNSLNR